MWILSDMTVLQLYFRSLNVERRTLYQETFFDFLCKYSKLLNVITSGQTKSDNINRMITIADDFCSVFFSKWDLLNMKTIAVDNINRGFLFSNVNRTYEMWWK